MTILLVGNKADLASHRQVKTEEGLKFAQDNGLIFIETSAKSAENVEKAFIMSAQRIYQNIVNNICDPANEANGIKLGSLAVSNNTSSAGANASNFNVTFDTSQQKAQSDGCC